LPTKAEASAIVFCEATAFGVPIVTYDTGGTAEYVKKGINGLCLHRDSGAADFASAIRTLLDARTYESLALRAFDEYRTRLNWGVSVKEIISICRTVAMRHGLAPMQRSRPFVTDSPLAHEKS
jgi:glycosyltransferase involved in cell wall biosynthesis